MMVFSPISNCLLLALPFWLLLEAEEELEHPATVSATAAVAASRAELLERLP
jgi:hypothetical protein